MTIMMTIAPSTMMRATPRSLLRRRARDAVEDEGDLDLERKTVRLPGDLHRVPVLEPLTCLWVEVAHVELGYVLRNDVADAAFERVEVDGRLLAPDQIHLVGGVRVSHDEVADLRLIGLV